MPIPPVTEEEFNRELNSGALSHPFAPFAITRLSLCLWHVLQLTGEAGARAFREHCAERDRHDRHQD